MSQPAGRRYTVRYTESEITYIGPAGPVPADIVHGALRRAGRVFFVGNAATLCAFFFAVFLLNRHFEALRGYDYTPPLLLFLAPLFVLPIFNLFFYLFGRVSLQYEENGCLAPRLEHIRSLVAILNNNPKLYTTDKGTAEKENLKGWETANAVHIRSSVITCKKPLFLRTNVPCFSITLPQYKVYLLPDKIIRVKGSLLNAALKNTVDVVYYSDLSIFVNDVDCLDPVQDGPERAYCLGEVPLHRTLNGEPDRRFKTSHLNVLLLRFGRITFGYGNETPVVLFCSNINTAIAFYETIRSFYHLAPLKKEIPYYPDANAEWPKRTFREKLGITPMMGKGGTAYATLWLVLSLICFFPAVYAGLWRVTLFLLLGNISVLLYCPRQKIRCIVALCIMILGIILGMLYDFT